MLKRLLNRTKDILFCKPLIPLWRRRLRGKAMVYLYHRVEGLGEHEFLDQGGSPITKPQEFSRDIQTLKQLGAKFIRFSELASCDYNSNDFYVVISIDDGFSSNYQAGMEIAENEGIPTTIFQCANMVNATKLLWEHQLYYLYFHKELGEVFQTFLFKKGWPNDCGQIRESISPVDIQEAVNEFTISHQGLSEEMEGMINKLYPTADHIREAQKSGHEIASHGDNHFKRSLINDDLFVAELVNSKRKLNSLLDRPINAFSYPFNSYHGGDDLICAQEYSLIATVDGGVVDKETKLLAIPRNTFPGHAKTTFRHRRWLLTGTI